METKVEKNQLYQQLATCKLLPLYTATDLRYFPEVIDFCLANEVPIFPGTATPGEIQRALAYGLRVVKFFPADIYGGLKAIKSLSGPFYDVQFLPTGGIDETNFIEYVEAKEVLAVGGSFILSEKMLQEDEASARQHVQSLLTKIKERQAK